VNVAARLEALADPGEICVSRTVVNHVKGKVRWNFEDRGTQAVKNIPEPVHVFRVMMEPEAAGESASAASRRIWWRHPVANAALAIAVAVVAVMAWQPWVTDERVTPVGEMSLPQPDKPSIAVLAFTNLSGDPGQTYFAEGIREDLITDLSKISGLFVIARNSTFAYRGRQVDVRVIASELGVQYVLEGSVQRAGDQLRVNAQLIDATTGGHVWADRYDGNVADTFAVQETFIRKIVKSLAVNLTEKEEMEIALGQTTNIKAREAFQEGWESYLNYSPDDNASAIGLFQRALELDPDYGRAYAAMGLAYLRGCQLRWNAPLGISIGMAYSRALMNLHEARNRPSSLANVAASRISLYSSQYDEALTEATRAIAEDPNDPEGYIAMAWAMITTGKPEPGLELVERAIRLNPNYPNYYMLARAMAYFMMDDLVKSADVLAKAIERDPSATELAPALASSYAYLGKMYEARAALQIWKPGKDQGELRYSLYTYHFPYEWSGDPDPLDRLIDGMFLAALPVGTTVSDLVERLRDGELRERFFAAEDLGRFGSQAQEAVPMLVAVLEEDGSKNLRKLAVIALGKIGPSASTALPALTAVVDEPMVGFHARAAIEKIDSQ